MTVLFRSFSALRLVVFCLASLFLGASFTDKISAQPVWSPIGNSSLISPSDIFPSFSAIGVNANTIFVPKSANNVWTLHRSLDNGTTWTTLSDPSVPVSPFSFHFNGSATFAYQFGDGLFWSFNNGTTWSRIDFVGSAPSAARLVPLTWDDVQIPTNYDQLIQSVALLRGIKDSVDAERRVYNVLTKALNNQYTIPRFGTFKSTSFPEIIDEDYNFILAAHSELTLDPGPELLALVNGDKSTLPQVNNDEDAVFAVIAKAMSSSALEPIPGYGWFVSLSRSAYIDANGMTQPAQKYPVFIRHSPLYRKQTTISGAAFSCYVYPRFGDFENGSIVWNLEHFCNDSVNALQYPFLQPYQPLRTPPSPAARASGVTGVYGTAMAGDGNSIFIAVANDHIYRTLDNGVSWAKVDNNLPSYGTVPNRYLDFFIFDTDVQGSTVFVVGNRGIFRSLDNGNSWTNVKAESSTETINSIICNGTRVLAYASSGKIYRSTDNGNSWQQVTVLPTQPTTGCKLVQGDGVVFAATESAGVYYSSDDGITWKKIVDSNPLLDAKLTAFAANSTSIFATTGVPGLNNNVYRMTGYSTLPRTDVSYAISGMSGINGASLALSGTATSSTSASATGAYSFSGLANGIYTVTPTLTGYVFVPSSTSVTISGASLSGVNFQAFTAPPPAPATVLTFSSVGASSATLTWNPPAGGAQNYIVVVRAGGAPSYTPVNGTSPTGVNSNFTLASPLADGSRIVYDGSGTSISLTGLSPQTSYTVVIFPSNGSGAMRSYQINAPLTGTQSTSALPQLQITPASLDFGSVTVGTVSTGSLTISGTSLLAAVNVTATNPALSLSLTNTPFTTQAVLSLTPTNGVLGATQIFVRFSPSVIGGYASTLTASSLNATSALVTVNGAGIQSQNRYSIFGSIGIASGVVTLGGAATQSTSASLVGAYSFSTLANGIYTVTPTLTGYIFTPSSTSVTIGGASAYGVNFQPFAVPPSAAATTLVFSSVNASSATIAWNPPVGGAQSYIVVVRPNGTPSYSPANGITPTGVNSDITLANALADGSRTVYDGSATSLLLTGLSPQTNYTVVVFPSNGAGALRSYQTIAPLTSSFVTLPPSRITLIPSALDFGSVTLGTVSTASFSVNGDGLTQALVLTSSGASFSLSLTGSPFTTQASLSFVPVSNTILPTTVFVRFTPSVTGASAGAILASGASTATLILNGTGTTPIPPPVLKAAFAGVRTPIDVTDLQAFTVTFRNAANALVDYPGVGGNVVHFRGGTPLGASTGTLTLTRLSLGTYQASSGFTGTGSYTLSLVGVTSTSGTRTFTVQASVNNPAPTLSSIAPATTTATTNTWTLTLNGSNFLPESRVIVDGVPLDQQNISFVSGALLKAQVVQPLAGVYSVVVENPTPGGGTSLPRTLTVNNPAPRLAAIEPVSVVAGQDAVLTLYGGYFTTATVVRFQNGAVTTTLAVLSLLSPTMATVTIPGSLITISGTYQIRAHTPVLGGGTSAAENLLVRGAAAVSSEFVNVTTSVVSGANLNAFTVRFRDSFGNLTNIASPVLGYGESTGATTGTIRLKYASTGVSTATATRMDIGGTYSLWINGIGTTTGSRSYTVTGGNDARVTFSGVPVSVTAGTVVPAFALRFEDAAGNLTDNGVGRLTYARAGGSSTATLALTRLSTGMYTAQSTVCTIAGAYNLAVSSVTPANTFGTKAFTLTPSSFVTVDFVISTSAMTTRGGSISVTANLFDAFGNRTDNLGGYDSLAVIVTNAEFPSSTATVAFARQSLGVYKAQVPVLLPGPYQSKLGGWKKGSELTGDPIIDTLLEILDRFLRESYDVSLSPGLAVRADFANVPTRLYVADTFSPEVDQANVTLRDVRGTRTHLWGGTVDLTINSLPHTALGTTSNTFSLGELTTTANLNAQLADYGKLYINPFVVSTLGTYFMTLNSTNGTPITIYPYNRTFTVQMPPARLLLPSLTATTLDFGSQFALAPTTRSYTLRYDQITTNTIVIAPTNHPSFLLSDSQNGIFTTSESITLTVSGTPTVPVSGTATLWARFVPVQGIPLTAKVKHTSTLADNITTVATVQLTMKGTLLAPMVNVTTGTVQFGQIDLGQTRYYGYTMTYRNITASTITIPIPAGNDFALTQVSSGTWTMAGQTLTLPTVQPATSATTQIQLWLRYTPTIAQATTVTLTHLADGGDLRTVDSDNLVLSAKKPPVLLSASPNSLSFGVFEANNSSTQTFTLIYQNIGSSITLTLPLGVSARLLSTGNYTPRVFSFTPSNFSGSAAIELQYTTTATSTLNGNISCTAFGTTATVVAVKGRTTTPPTTLSFQPNPISFGSVVAGFSSTSTYTLTYQNVSGPINITLPDGISGRSSPSDSFQPTFLPLFPPSPNGSFVIELQYSPTAAGTLNDNIVHRNSSSGTNISLNVLGKALSNSPYFTILSSELNFGIVTSGSVSTTQTYTIRYGNLTASGNLQIEPPANSGIEVALLPNGVFKSTTDATIKIGAGQFDELSIAVRYTPLSSTNTINTNIAHTMMGLTTTNLLVKGIAYPAPRLVVLQHVFEKRAVGGVYTSTYTVQYAYLTTSTINVQIADRNFTSGNPPRYAVSLDDGTTFIDDKNTIVSFQTTGVIGSKTFTVRFSPVAVGARLATVTHFASSTNANAYLFGVGLDPGCTPAAAPAQFAALTSAPGGPGEPPSAQIDPTRRIAVYLLNGVEKTVSGKALRIADNAPVRSILVQYNITDGDIKPYLPDFSGDNLIIDEGPDNKIKLMDYSNMFLLTAVDSSTALALTTALRNHPDVFSVSQDGRAEVGDIDPELHPNDPYMNNKAADETNGFYNINGMNQMSIRRAWGLFQGDPTLDIGIFDEGVDKDHEDFAGRIKGPLLGYENPLYLYGANGDYYRDHGTGVAYIAAATGNNCIGAAGVDWNAKLFSYGIDLFGEQMTKAFTKDGDETKNMFVTNHSYGDGYGSTVTTYRKEQRSAFALAYKNNRLSVTIMHNFGDKGNPIIYPASYKGNGNIATGAIGSEYENGLLERRTPSSGFHNYIDVSAPSYGVITGTPLLYNGEKRIKSPFLLDKAYDVAQTAPTSAAAPMVSGLATLVKGYARKVKSGFELDNDDVENIIKLSAEPLPGKVDPDSSAGVVTYGTSWNPYIGYGRINAYKALVMVRDNTIEHKMVQPNSMTWHEESTTYTLEVRATPPESLKDAVYKVRRYEMRTTITLSSADATVWGRGAGKESWGLMAEDTIPSDRNNTILPSGEKVQYGMGGCEIVPGTRTATSVTLRTYIYRVQETKGSVLQNTWFPCAPENVRYYYTVMSKPTMLAQVLEKSVSNLTGQVPSAKNIVPDTGDIRDEAYLLPIYPNPGNNEVTVEFDLPSSAAVSFEVLDILGRQIHQAQEQQYASGTHNLLYLIKGLPNGSYTLRMKIRQQASGTIIYRLRQFTILH
ncbi:MAG: fibronectin type III domain-containing protein [Ignavibacteria bacterium]|nr:fibronectin type III domain-containing protein [Ignavibacteria bacterium]